MDRCPTEFPPFYNKWGIVSAVEVEVEVEVESNP